MASTTRVKRSLFGLGLACTAFWLHGCGSDAPETPDATPGSTLPAEAEADPGVAPEEPAALDPLERTGPEVYAQLCALCHGVNGDGEGIVELDRKARSFADGHFSFGNTREALFRTVSAGIGGTPMPGFASGLSEAERWAVVDHVIALGPEREVVERSATIMTVTDRPLVVRGGFAPLEPGGPEYPRGALLGGLDGLSFQYDVEDVRLVAVRQGEFVQRRDWANRGGDTLAPLGVLIQLVPDGVGIWRQGGTPLWARLKATDVSGELAAIEYDLVLRDPNLTPLERYDHTQPLQPVATVRETAKAISRGGWSGYRRTFEVELHSGDVAFDLGGGEALDWGATLRPLAELPVPLPGTETGAGIVNLTTETGTDASGAGLGNVDSAAAESIELALSPLITIEHEVPLATGYKRVVDHFFGLPATPENLAALEEAL